MSASTIISTLWGATDAKTLTDEQLATLSCNEDLSSDLSNIAEIMNGIACLVAEDGHRETRAGNFQDSDLIAQLLWTLSDVIKANAEASFVASQAQFVLQRREQKRKPTGMQKESATP